MLINMLLKIDQEDTDYIQTSMPMWKCDWGTSKRKPYL